MNFVIFLLNFDEFLSEFHEELQKITDILDIFTKLPEKFGKMLEISGFCDEFHSSVSLFSIDSLLSTEHAALPPVRHRRFSSGVAENLCRCLCRGLPDIAAEEAIEY